MLFHSPKKSLIRIGMAELSAVNVGMSGLRPLQSELFSWNVLDAVL